MTPTPKEVRRNRGVLLLIVALFFGSLLLAGILRFSGWRPAGTKNFGELLDPPGDLRAHAPTLLDGRAYPWQPRARMWRIVVAPPADCGPPAGNMRFSVSPRSRRPGWRSSPASPIPSRFFSRTFCGSKTALL